MCYSGEPLTVQVPGTQTRSFCYVSDMVYIILVSLLSVVILIQVLGVIDYDHIYAWNLLGWWTYTSNGRGKHWSNQHWEPRLYYNTFECWLFCQILICVDTSFFQVNLQWLNLPRMWKRLVVTCKPFQFLENPHISLLC